MTQLTDDPRFQESLDRVALNRNRVDHTNPQIDSRLQESLDRVESERLASRNPFGTFTATDFTDTSFGENARRGFVKSTAPFVAPFGEVGARIAESAEFETPPSHGAGGFIGSTAGSVLPSVLMIVAPSTAPAVAAAFAGVAASEDFRENQNVQSAIGAAVFEATAEFVGAGLIRKVGIKSAQRLGQAVLKGDAKAVTIIGLAALQDAGIEGGEEVLTLIGDVTNKVAAGLLTPQQAIERLKSEGGITFAGGVTGGLMLAPVSAVLPATIREFKRASKDISSLSTAVNELSVGERDALLSSVNNMIVNNEKLLSEEGGGGEKLSNEEFALAKAIQRKLQGAVQVDAAVAIESVESEGKKRDEGDSLQPQTQDVDLINQTSAARSILQDSETTSDQKARSLILTETDKLRQELVSQRKAAITESAESKRRERAHSRQQVKQLIDRANSGNEDIRQLAADTNRFIRESKLPKDQKNALLASVPSAIRTNKQLAGFANKILAAELAFEKTEAQSDLKKALKDASSFKGLSPSDKKALDGITQNIDPKDIKDKTSLKIQGLVDHLARNPDTQLSKGQIENLKRLGQKPVFKFSADEANDVSDAINTILRQAELKNKLIGSIKDRDKAKILNQIKSEIHDNTLFPTDEPREPGDPRKLLKPRERLESGELSPETKESVLNLIYGLEHVASIDTIAEFISGSDHSLTHQVLVDDVNIGRELSADRYYEISDAWKSGLQDLGVSPGGTQLQAMSDQLNQKVGFTKKVFGKKQVDVINREVEIGGKTVKMTPGRWMMLSALLKDNSTLDLVMFGKNKLVAKNLLSSDAFGMSGKDVQTVEDSLSTQEKQMVALFVDIMNGPVQGSYINYTMKKDGVDKTQEGVWVSRRRRFVDPESRSDINLSNMHQKAADNVGLDKFRTRDTKQLIEIPDIFVEFANVAWTVSNLEFLTPALTAANQVISDPGVIDALERTRGKRAIRAFRTTYDAVASEVVGRTISPAITDTAFRNLVRKTTTALLGFNLPVMGYQPVSLIHAREEIPLRFLIQSTLQGSQIDSKIDDRMHRVGWIRFRNESSILGKINEGSQGGQSLLGFRGEENVGMIGIRYMDLTTIRAIWRAAELQAMEELGREDVNDDLVFQETATTALRAIRRTQPTTDPMTLSGVALARRNSDAAALLFMFRTQLAKTIDMTKRNVMRASRTPSFLPKAIANIAMTWVASSFAIEAIREFYRWLLRGFKDDPEDENGIFKRLVTNTFFRMASIPLFIGTLSNLARGYFSPSFSAVESVIGDMVTNTTRASIALVKGEGFSKILEPAIDAAALIIGVRTGAPVVSPVREIKRVIKSINDDTSKKNNRRGKSRKSFGG